MSRILICTMLATLLPAALFTAPAPASVTLRYVAAGPPGPVDPGGPPSRSTGEFGWPLPGVPAVVRAFEAPSHRYGPGHRGVDLAAASGTPALAAGTGTVVFAGPVAGRGVVSIDHDGGLRTTYEPISPSVAAGDLVTRGEQIGTIQPGHPGCGAAACLHWGARRGTAYLDPLRLLGLGQVRLLPWDGGLGKADLQRVMPSSVTHSGGVG